MHPALVGRSDRRAKTPTFSCRIASISLRSLWVAHGYVWQTPLHQYGLKKASGIVDWCCLSSRYSKASNPKLESKARTQTSQWWGWWCFSFLLWSPPTRWHRCRRYSSFCSFMFVPHHLCWGRMILVLSSLSSSPSRLQLSALHGCWPRVAAIGPAAQEIVRLARLYTPARVWCRTRCPPLLYKK